MAHRANDDDETVDRTPWPINRLSYQDLKAAELEAIEHLFTARDDTPLVMKWVMMHKQGNVFRQRLLVVSALRIWLLRRKTSLRTSLECAQMHQLMHISKIMVMRCGTAPSTNPATPSASTSPTVSLKIQFASPASSSSGNLELSTLHIDPGVHTESVVRLLQRQLHSMRLVFPSCRLPPLRFPPRYHWQEFFTADISQDNQNGQDDSDSNRGKEQMTAITAAYRAFCDDVGVPYRSSVMERLRECISSLSCVDFQYCLALPAGEDPDQHRYNNFSSAAAVLMRCLGLGPPARSTILLRETQALARSLENAECVENIVIDQLPVKPVGIAALFQSLLSSSSSVRGLALNSVQLTAPSLRVLQNVVLQSTIKRDNRDDQDQGHAQPGHQLQLRRLDLSFNRFSPKMAVELAITLELLPLGLELLQLEQCALSIASSCLIVSALGSNAAFAGALCELNMSDNHLGHDGTKALASWLTGAVALRRLDVSHTALDLNACCLALQQNSVLSESTLEYLDISSNRMRTQASQSLGLVLGKTRSLSTLVARGMAKLHVGRVTVAGRVIRLHGAARAKIKHERTSVQKGVVGSSKARHMRGLKCRHLSNLLVPMFSNTNRAQPCLLDLSENDLRGKRAELLSQLLDASPTAARESLRLDHACLHDKSVRTLDIADPSTLVRESITHRFVKLQSLLLLHSIRGCSMLHSLSLEGNGFIKRSAQRQRARIQTGRPSRTSSTTPTIGSSLERAAARALSLLLGGPSQHANTDKDDTKDTRLHEQHKPLTSSELDETNNQAMAPPSADSSLCPQLRELSLKSYAAFVYGTHVITAVINALPSTSTLRVLDVSGNECGDALACALGNVLPRTSSLRVLFWDDNCTSVDGLVAFYTGLLANRSLTMVQMPVHDTRRVN